MDQYQKFINFCIPFIHYLNVPQSKSTLKKTVHYSYYINSETQPALKTFIWDYLLCFNYLPEIPFVLNYSVINVFPSLWITILKNLMHQCLPVLVGGRGNELERSNNIYYSLGSPPQDCSYQILCNYMMYALLQKGKEKHFYVM